MTATPSAAATITSATASAGSATPSSALVPVILCGGTGTRLWPLSRASYPKQYWALAGSGEETLLQQTQLRLRGLGGLASPSPPWRWLHLVTGV